MTLTVFDLYGFIKKFCIFNNEILLAFLTLESEIGDPLLAGFLQKANFI